MASVLPMFQDKWKSFRQILPTVSCSIPQICPQGIHTLGVASRFVLEWIGTTVHEDASILAEKKKHDQEPIIFA